MVCAAFTAWQLGAGGKKNLKKYLSDFGLSDKPEKIGKKTRRQMADRAYRIAERIMAMDKRK